jgi:hypothetical protein
MAAMWKQDGEAGGSGLFIAGAWIKLCQKGQ